MPIQKVYVILLCKNNANNKLRIAKTVQIMSILLSPDFVAQKSSFYKWSIASVIQFCVPLFWGTTENAVRIQISSAIIAYCLVAIVQHDLQLKRSTYEVLQIISISLMDKTPLVDLFERTDFNNVKELDCPLFPGLFD